jgi:hypothetical protein
MPYAANTKFGTTTEWGKEATSSPKDSAVKASWSNRPILFPVRRQLTKWTSYRGWFEKASRRRNAQEVTPEAKSPTAIRTGIRTSLIGMPPMRSRLFRVRTMLPLHRLYRANHPHTSLLVPVPLTNHKYRRKKPGMEPHAGQNCRAGATATRYSTISRRMSSTQEASSAPSRNPIKILRDSRSAVCGNVNTAVSTVHSPIP